MKKHLNCLFCINLLGILILGVFLTAGCGGGGGGGVVPDLPAPTATVPVVNPTATPTTPPVVDPTAIPTPPTTDPTPTPPYVTDPNEFGPIASGKCHGNFVAYEIDASAKDLASSGSLVLLTGVDLKVYDREGGTLKYSGTTGSNGDFHVENMEPGTYWIEFHKSGFTDIKRNQEFFVGQINIANGIFNAP